MTTVPTSRGAAPLTWAIWVVALSPLLQVIGISFADFEGYFRAVADQALRSGGSTTQLTFTPQLASSFVSIGAASLLGLLASVVFVVFAAVDWTILRRRIDRPFHWAWSFFVLLSLGAFVYPIGRTVIAHGRTGRSASAPLIVFIVLTVAGFAISIAKVVAAFAVFIPLISAASSAG